MNLTYNTAKERLLTNLDESCERFFVASGCTIEYAYSMLIKDNLKEAQTLFEEYKDTDIRAKGAVFMISLIKDELKEYATYFELRNFLEIDLDILIHYCKGDYVEKIVRYADFMYTINPEVYKFIGRVFYNNDLKEHALWFLKRAKNYFYNDPELHCLLSYIYYKEKDYKKSRQAAKECLSILPEYFPAKNMLTKLDNIQFSKNTCF